MLYIKIVYKGNFSRLVYFNHTTEFRCVNFFHHDMKLKLISDLENGCPVTVTLKYVNVLEFR